MMDERVNSAMDGKEGSTGDRETRRLSTLTFTDYLEILKRVPELYSRQSFEKGRGIEWKTMYVGRQVAGRFAEWSPKSAESIVDKWDPEYSRQAERPLKGKMQRWRLEIEFLPPDNMRWMTIDAVGFRFRGKLLHWRISQTLKVNGFPVQSPESPDQILRRLIGPENIQYLEEDFSPENVIENLKGISVIEKAKLEV